MATSIFKLVGSIFVENGDANKKIEDTGKKAETLSSKVSRGISAVGKIGVGIATATAGASAALLGVATSAANSLDEVQKGAQQLGMSYENYQKLSYACDRSGTSIDKLSKGMKNITNVIGGMVSEDNKAVEALDALGISTANADGTMRSAESVMTDALLALADMEDETKRNAYANQIFGASYQDLQPLLNSGSEGIKELMQNAEDLGLVMGDEAVENGAKFKDQLDDIKASVGAMATKIGADLMPYVQKAFDWVQEHLPQVEEVAKGVFDKIKGFVETMLPLLGGLKSKIISEIWPKIMEIVNSEEFKAFLDNVIQFATDLYNKFVNDVWPVLKEGIAQVWEILKGVWAWFKDEALPFIQEHIWPILKDIFDWLSKTLKDTIEWFNNNVVPVLKNLYERVKARIPEIKQALDKFFDGVSKFFDALGPALDKIIEILKEYLWPAIEMIIDSPLIDDFIDTMLVFLDDMKIALDGLSKFLGIFKGDWEGAWEGIVTFVGTSVKTILTTFNPLYNTLKAIKDMIEWINNSEVEGTAYDASGSSHSISAMQAKYSKMATGGEIASAGMAIVGEAGAELIEMPRGARVTPLNDNNNAFAEMSSKLDVLADLLSNFAQMGVYINGNALVGQIAPNMDKTLGSYSRRAERSV